MLRLLVAVLPASMRERQMHEWEDHLECARDRDGDSRHALMALARATPAMAWNARVPVYLRISLLPLAAAMAAALVFWPGGPAAVPPEDLQFPPLFGRPKLQSNVTYTDSGVWASIRVGTSRAKVACSGTVRTRRGARMALPPMVTGPAGDARWFWEVPHGLPATRWHTSVRCANNRRTVHLAHIDFMVEGWEDVSTACDSSMSAQRCTTMLCPIAGAGPPAEWRDSPEIASDRSRTVAPGDRWVRGVFWLAVPGGGKAPTV
jgi:hypothetical protein